MALAFDWAAAPEIPVDRPDEAPIASHARRFLVISSLAAFLVVCFAAIAAWEMGYGRGHALAVSQAYMGADADRTAAQAGRTLDRLAALGLAFVARYDAAAVQDVVETTDSGQVLNIAVADANGVFRSALAGDPSHARALAPSLLRQVEFGRAVVPFSDPVIGSSPLTVILKTDETPTRYIVIPLDPKVVIPVRALGVTALVAPDGRALAHSDGAQRVPPFVPYPNLGAPIAKIVVSFGEEHLVAATPVPGWPLAAAASSRVSDILADWHASLPYYIFLILGPALAGAAVTIYLARHNIDAEHWAEYWAEAQPVERIDTPRQTLRDTLQGGLPRQRTAEIISLHAAE